MTHAVLLVCSRMPVFQHWCAAEVLEMKLVGQDMDMNQSRRTRSRVLETA